MFHSISHRGRTALAVEELLRGELEHLARDPEFPLRSDSVETVKDGDGVLVAKTGLMLETGFVPVAYKRVHRASLLKQMTHTMSPNRARQAFDAGHRLLQLDIATARPLAVVVPSRFDVTAPSWLATEWVDGAVDLAEFYRLDISGESADPQERGLAVTIALGRLIGRMHVAGVAHRDLKPQNLMVRTGPRLEDAEIITVDLDGVRFPGRISARRRWKNLSRLTIGDRGRGWPGLSLALRGRFLEAYLEAAGRPVSFREAWQSLEKVTVARLARRAA